MTESVDQRTQRPLPEQADSPLSRREGSNSTLSNAALAQQCLRERDAYCHGESCDGAHGLELLRRATAEGDSEAREWLQRCFGQIVHAWLRRHPSGATACCLESDEKYVAQAFERFWQLTVLDRQLSFGTLVAALQYLHASLYGVILDALRLHSQPQKISLPELGERGELDTEDVMESREVWEILQRMLPTQREQRLAYLLYHCGLKPGEIAQCYPQEWSDVEEISLLRRRILERVLHNADQLGICT